MEKNYTAPAIRDLGSVRELTLQGQNKVGPTPDVFTAITNGSVVGSLTGILN